MHRRSLLAGLSGATLLPAVERGGDARLADEGRTAAEEQGGAPIDRAVAWTREFQPVPEEEGVSVASDEELVVVGGERLTARAAGSGVRRWTRGELDAPVAATVGDREVVLLSQDGTLRGLAREDGSTRWSVSAEREPQGVQAAPVVREDTTYAAVGDWIGAVDDGTVVWERGLDARTRGIALTGDRLVVASGRTVLALDATSGEERWRATVGVGTSRVSSPEPAVHDPAVVGGRVVVVGTDGVAYGVADGAVEWSAGVDGRLVLAPESRTGRVGDHVVVVRRTHVPDSRRSDSIAPGLETHVTAVAPGDGTSAWTTTLPGLAVVGDETDGTGPRRADPTAAPPVAAHGVLYVPGVERTYALDPATGDHVGRWGAFGWKEEAQFDALATAGDRLVLATRSQAVVLAPASCPRPSAGTASATYTAPRPAGWQLEADLRLEEVEGVECRSLYTASVLLDGEVIATHSEVVDVVYGPAPSVTYYGQDFPEDESVAVRVRGSDGTVVGERTVDVEYREPDSDLVESAEDGDDAASDDATTLWPAAVLAGIGGGLLATARRASGERDEA